MGQLTTSGNDSFATSGNSWYANPTAPAVGLYGINNAINSDPNLSLVAVNQFANFFFATNNTANDKALGAWDLTLDSTTGAASLSYVVPVPATAWLMLSGLAGLFSVSRRKAA
jgi:hypothetical protein